jgi:hypothetical protein
LTASVLFGRLTHGDTVASFRPLAAFTNMAWSCVVDISCQFLTSNCHWLSGRCPTDPMVRPSLVRRDADPIVLTMMSRCSTSMTEKSHSSLFSIAFECELKSSCIADIESTLPPRSEHRLPSGNMRQN